MARSGDTTFIPNQHFFDTMLRRAEVIKLVDKSAGNILGIAKADAPVDTGAYRDGLHLEHHESRYRQVADVVGSDPKTLLIESRTGNLARSVKKGAKR